MEAPRNRQKTSGTGTVQHPHDDPALPGIPAAGAASHYIDNDSRLIITTWEGDATDNDFYEALKRYIEDIQHRQEYSDFNEVVDLRKMSRIRLSIKGMINIGRLASSTDQYRNKTKLAFIVSSDLAYNFAKLYATYRNFGKKNKKVIHIFKNERNAISWARTRKQ